MKNRVMGRNAPGCFGWAGGQGWYNVVIVADEVTSWEGFEMQPFVALLRAVNVGGTGTLVMPDLKRLCQDAGLQAGRTYIASGNVAFQSALDAKSLQRTLQAALHSYAGQPIGVVLRTGAEIDAVTGRVDGKELRLGRREIYVWYGQGMSKTKLCIPAARHGTARNMNTVTKLAAMAAA